MNRKLYYGMVGGGPGAGIGPIHRSAIRLDDCATLAAGCFSADPAKSRQTARELNLAADRVYPDFMTMARQEGSRPDRIDFVVIAVPNNLHYPACREFLLQGISVMCEKPLTVNLAQALELKRLAAEHGCLFGVSYVYTGHVMARAARDMIRNGEIGEIMMVMAEYPQDWLIEPAEKCSVHAAWRTDPGKAGPANSVGDIGTHIENLVHYMTGLKISQLCASLDIFGEDRVLDTNATILLRYTNGARGCYWCSQVAIGYDNALKVRVFGTKGAIEFEQEKCNELKVTCKGQPTQVYTRGHNYVAAGAAAFSRLPSGHPEGYYEALANLYKAFTKAVAEQKQNGFVDESMAGYPNIERGIDGVRFIVKCVESSRKGSAWVDMDDS
jgi:predicted dehydrogenase